MQLPTDFLERMRQVLGTEYEQFLASQTAPAPVSLRLNPAKTNPDFSNLEQVPWHPNGRYLSERPVFTLDPAFHAGAYYVQEASSMLIYQAMKQTVGIGQPINALDLCAAPGGKSTLLVSTIGEGGILVSNEAIKTRVPALKMNLEKWGYANMLVSNHDPQDFEKLVGFFDLVLVDAPCSGEGLFRKDSEAASHWSLESVSHCAARQNRILDAAKALLKEGGILVYSTCTYNDFENEGQVQSLINDGGFEQVRLEIPASWGVTEKKYGYQCYPHKVKGEGFYFAVLRKKGPNKASNLKSLPPKDWQKLPSKQFPIFSDWISQYADYEYFTKPDGMVVAIKADLIEQAFSIGSALRKRSLGLEIGELKKQSFIPSHALALSKIAHQNLPRLELEKTAALRFLKKDNIWEEGYPRGWVLANYQGLPLGWLKIMDNRSNNYLPMNWRIRMELEQKHD